MFVVAFLKLESTKKNLKMVSIEKILWIAFQKNLMDGENKYQKIKVILL